MVEGKSYVNVGERHPLNMDEICAEIDWTDLPLQQRVSVG